LNLGSLLLLLKLIHAFHYSIGYSHGWKLGSTFKATLHYGDVTLMV